MSTEFDLSYDLDSILSEFTEDASPELQESVPLQKEAESSDPLKKPEPPEASAFTPDGDPITHFADKYRRTEPEKKKTPPLKNRISQLRPRSETKTKVASPALNPEKKPGTEPAPDVTRIMPVKEPHADATRRISGKTPPVRSPSAETEAVRDAQEAKKLASKAAREERDAQKQALKAAKEARKAQKQALKEERRRLREEKPPRLRFADVTPQWLVRIVGMLLTMGLCLFVLCTVSPASGSAAAAKTIVRTADLAASVNKFATEKARDAAIAESAVQEQIAEQIVAAQKTFFRIPEDAVVAPDPLVSGFGKVSTANAAEIMPIIQQARDSGLLGPDEAVIFDPNVEFNTGSYYQDIQYYIDNTLLVICWKEIINGNTCTFCEVKTQDGSQLRRKLAGDMFGSDILEYTTSMHKATNSVVSMNADYYRFRDMGIVAYNRQLYRFNEGDYLMRYGRMLKKYNCIDTMFVTASGDFLFFHMGEESSPEAMQQYIDENDIIFSVAFGPVLVENWELNYDYFDEEWYPIGEINTGYSRAGIGQVCELHYLYMSLNHSDEKAARWHTKEFAEHFYEKGVKNAYSLDGGQTSEIVFQGNEAYNHVDHVNGTSSRQVSDMIYFASAVNGEEVTQ